MKLHAGTNPREAHEGLSRLPLAHAQLRQTPRDEGLAVADPARERLRDVCPTLVPLGIFHIRHAALVEPRRFWMQAQVPGVRSGERLDEEPKDDLARREIKQVEAEAESERVGAQPSPPSSTSP